MLNRHQKLKELRENEINILLDKIYDPIIKLNKDLLKIVCNYVCFDRTRDKQIEISYNKLKSSYQISSGIEAKFKLINLLYFSVKNKYWVYNNEDVYKYIINRIKNNYDCYNHCRSIYLLSIKQYKYYSQYFS